MYIKPEHSPLRFFIVGFIVSFESRRRYHHAIKLIGAKSLRNVLTFQLSTTEAGCFAINSKQPFLSFIYQIYLCFVLQTCTQDPNQPEQVHGADGNDGRRIFRKVEKSQFANARIAENLQGNSANGW